MELDFENKKISRWKCVNDFSIYFNFTELIKVSYFRNFRKGVYLQNWEKKKKSLFISKGNFRWIYRIIRVKKEIIKYNRLMLIEERKKTSRNNNCKMISIRVGLVGNGGCLFVKNENGVFHFYLFCESRINVRCRIEERIRKTWFNT